MFVAFNPANSGIKCSDCGLPVVFATKEDGGLVFPSTFIHETNDRTRAELRKISKCGRFV